MNRCEIFIEYKQRLTNICKALEIGVHGNMFGGTMMSLIDESSAAYAAQLCDTPRMVTVSIEQCNSPLVF